MNATNGSGQVVIKTENVKVESNVGESAEELFNLIASHENGIDAEVLTALTPSLDPKERQNALNFLLSAQRLDILKAAGKFKFKVKNLSAVSDGTAEEQLVYQLIEEAQANGIWIRELRDGSGLPVLQLRKVLKALELKQVIKAVKVVGTTRKCYMLSHFEPGVELTGGTFYSDQQLDSELISILITVSIGFLQTHRRSAMEQHPTDLAMQKELSYVRVSEIAQYVKEKRVLTIPITENEIDRILDVAVLDGTIERRGDRKVRASAHDFANSPAVSIPCVVCPVINDCKPGHVISPESCEYMKSWLE